VSGSDRPDPPIGAALHRAVDGGRRVSVAAETAADAGGGITVAPTKLILDVDTGTDDAVALMFAALHPDLELVAATTVNGNVPVELCTENTLRVFDVIGANVPVYEGARRPMLRPDFPVSSKEARASGIHGEYLDLPPARSAKQRERAVDFLIDTYMSPAGPDIVLVPVGPLTNIALAMAVEPRIVERIPRMIIMGGGHEIGNVTPAAEFNIWADPEAAKVVLTSGVQNLTLVPLDATHKALVTLDDCRRLRALGTPAGAAAATVVERRIAGYEVTQPMALPNSAPVHDVLCVAAIVDPAVITTYPFHADVETTGELTVGRTVIDTHRRRGLEPNAHVALDADGETFVRLMMETFARTLPGSAG
jgi:inosine-uridine nucleoside N-ribohydrolase